MLMPVVRFRPETVYVCGSERTPGNVLKCVNAPDVVIVGAVDTQYVRLSVGLV